MSARRDEILREMGIWPAWRLRHDATAQPAAREAPPAPVAAEVAADQPVAAAAVAVAAAPAPLGDRASAILRMDWSELDAAVSACVACPLHQGRTKAVFGVGDTRADWLFVGEGPGAEEDLKGEPFVGQAGKLLDNMLQAIGLKRGANVYIANVVKCRPPGNRNPEPAEAAQCEPYLARQIELLQPKLIVALGKVAAVNLLQREATVVSLRGKVHEYRAIPMVVTYHPAYLLRSLPDKAKAWADLRFAVDTMARLQSGLAVPT